MKVLLLTNYREDRQWSMLKFGRLLINKIEKNENIKIDEIFPRAHFGRWNRSKNLFKWASYLDKYLLFPRKLKFHLQQNKINNDIVHIIDHSNAPYLKIIAKASSAKCLLTCHDLIAVRSAIGDFSMAPKTSRSGKRLQKWIKNSLTLADYFACDSKQTKSDLNKFVPSSGLRSKVIHLGTNLDTTSKTNQVQLNTELPINPLKIRYILHVGSAAWYKNRKSVFSSFQFAKNQSNTSDLKLILVGPPPQAHETDSSIKEWIDYNNKDIISISDATEQTLQTLYQHAELLVFPSYIEGFGWPPLEAASIGCPVISSKTGAIDDLLGKNAIYVDPTNQDLINLTVSKLLAKKQRKKLKVCLPNNQKCQENYFELYQTLNG